MDDLIAFLLAREDEREAAASVTGDQSPAEVFSVAGHDRDCARAIMSQAQNDGRSQPLDDTQVGHLLAIGFRRGQQKPPGVCADIDSKRRIIELVGAARKHGSENAGEWTADILPLLALPYVDHPEFKPEWRP